MPRHVSPPKSIADYGGLRDYLNATKAQHNGLGYAEWCSRVNPNRKHPVPKTVIAEDFGVSPQTVYNWLKIHSLEVSTLDASRPPQTAD